MLSALKEAPEFLIVGMLLYSRDLRYLQLSSQFYLFSEHW